MKKSILLLMFLAATAGAFAQKTINSISYASNGDTIKTIVSQAPPTVIVPDPVVTTAIYPVKAKVAPVTPVTPVTPVIPITPAPPATGIRTYKASGPLNFSNQSNITISGLAFDNPGATQLTLTGCTHVHITLCRFSNASAYAVKIYKCTDVTIDYSFFTNVAFGVYAQESTIIKINSNQCLNLKGGGSVLAHFAQLDNVKSGGNQINYNRIENIAGIAVQPHDIISIYESSGLPGDSIQVIGNWIRGGQLALNAAGNNGACGIGLVDQNGSYQVARYNILVNPGYAGIAPVGAGNAVKIDHNTIYSDQTPISLVGLTIQSNNVYAGYNKINWATYKGTKQDAWVSPGVSQPAGWATNALNAPIKADILPVIMITYN